MHTGIRVRIHIHTNADEKFMMVATLAFLFTSYKRTFQIKKLRDEYSTIINRIFYIL
jgi:hypothetical protein